MSGGAPLSRLPRLVDEARACCAARFGREATHVGAASGRVNLIGDHVDYAGGCVLPMSLALGTVAAVARADGDADRVVSTDARHDARAYALGVLTELRAELASRHGVSLAPLAVAVASDLPVGAGLSSSAALEVAVARAALAHAQAGLEPARLAVLCQRAEHVHAGVPCGIMDQWCVAHADPDASEQVAILLDCARHVHEPVALPRALRIEVVDSGVRHALRDGGYAARRSDVLEAARRIDCPLDALPSATSEQIARLPDRIARRARHVVSEVARVRAAVDALRAGDLVTFGGLIDASHASLRDDFDVSTPEVDRVVEAARGRGALGARMTGGGFGGSVVAAFDDRHR